MSVVCFQPSDAPVGVQGIHVEHMSHKPLHAGITTMQALPGRAHRVTQQQLRGVRHSEHHFGSHPLISWAGSGMEVPGLQIADQLKGKSEDSGFVSAISP